MAQQVADPHLPTDAPDMPRRVGELVGPTSLNISGTLLEVVVGNLIEAQVEGVVNAANGALQMGGGVAGAIRRQDVDGRVDADCQKINKEYGQLEEGAAAITRGWKGGPKWVIHAVGPVYRAAHHEACVKRLYSAYWAALSLAVEWGVKSVAFPFVSAGIFGFTADKGSAHIALTAVQDFLVAHPGELERVQFVSLPRDADIRNAFLGAIREAYR